MFAIGRIIFFSLCFKQTSKKCSRQWTMALGRQTVELHCLKLLKGLSRPFTCSLCRTEFTRVCLLDSVSQPQIKYAQCAYFSSVALNNKSITSGSSNYLFLSRQIVKLTQHVPLKASLASCVFVMYSREGCRYKELEKRTSEGQCRVCSWGDEDRESKLRYFGRVQGKESD